MEMTGGGQGRPLKELGALAALGEDLCSIPSIHMIANNQL